MSAPCAGIHPTALVGEPPQHRDYRAKQDSQNYGVAFFRPLIDETALLEAYVTVDAGVSRYTKIGAHVWLMKNVHVGHDAVIGDGCELAPMTSVGGHVVLGRNVRVGQGATFKPFVTVGDGARIGMGAVVTRDVPAGEVWAGNPARRLKDAGPPRVSVHEAAVARGLVARGLAESVAEAYDLLIMQANEIRCGEAG